MFKTLALIALTALAALLIYAATRPDVFRVERSVRIQAPAPQLFGLIDNLRQMNRWNPYNKKDPAMKLVYQGPEAGPGAAFEFDGNKEVGAGRIGVTASQAPTRVAMTLDMARPFAAHNDIEFTLAPDGDATRVTWAMQGPSPYIGKLMGLIFNMDRMIGGDFERGLADLKTLAEAR